GIGTGFFTLVTARRFDAVSECNLSAGERAAFAGDNEPAMAAGIERQEATRDELADQRMPFLFLAGCATAETCEAMMILVPHLLGFVTEENIGDMGGAETLAGFDNGCENDARLCG